MMVLKLKQNINGKSVICEKKKIKLNNEVHISLDTWFGLMYHFKYNHTYNVHNKCK